MTIAQMGGAIEHWLGFQDKIGRSFMMNEDALKYPLSDYLVNDGGIDITSIELEYPHPNFSHRLVDLAVIDRKTKGLNHAFELKIANTTTRAQTGRQRIFDDIMRLHLARSSAAKDCYFIITGKAAHFQRDFRDFTTKTGLAFYRKWFAFAKGQRVAFNVATETDTNYQPIYQTFLNEYSANYKGTGLTLPNQITITCEFITAYKQQFVPYLAGIWSVS